MDVDANEVIRKLANKIAQLEIENAVLQTQLDEVLKQR